MILLAYGMWFKPAICFGKFKWRAFQCYIACYVGLSKVYLLMPVKIGFSKWSNVSYHTRKNVNVQLDVSYSSVGIARSYTGRYFLPRNLPANKQPISLNGNIHIACVILKFVDISAIEAELGALIINTCKAQTLWLILSKLWHSQLPTPILVDNTTTIGIVNNTIRCQQSCAMKMCYFWLLDPYTLKHFHFQHHLGQANLGNYPSNYHTGLGHQNIQPYYLHKKESPIHLPGASTRVCWNPRWPMPQVSPST